MKQLIFATNNATKSKRFSKGLKEYDIEILSLKDINLTLDVNEDGSDAISNALIKARACYNATKKASMGMDDTLYFDGVPDDLQPGLFVRRVNGKTLTDEEMIEHYTNLVKKYGVDGKLNCKYVYGLAVINEKGEEYTYTWEKTNFYMVDTVSDKMNSGYPLDSISKYKGLDKYFSELSEDEKKNVSDSEDHVVSFIKSHI